MHAASIFIALAVGGFLLGRAFSPQGSTVGAHQHGDSVDAPTKITAINPGHGFPLGGTDLQIATAISDQLEHGDPVAVFESAWSALDALPSIRQRELKAIILRWWARLDPQSALSTIAAAEDGYHNSILMEEWSLSDPHAAFEASAKLHPSSFSRQIVITTMARSDRTTALAKTLSADMHFPSEAIADWAEESFADAFDFRLRHPEYFDPTNSIPKLAEQLNGSPEKMRLALRQLANTPLPPDDYLTAERAKSQLLVYAERYASAELLESETVRADFAHIFDDWMSHAPDEAMAWLDSQPPDAEFRTEAIVGFLENMHLSRDQLPKIDAYLDELPAKEQVVRIMNDLLQPFPEKDLQSNLAWIESFQPRLDESKYFELVERAIREQAFETRQQHLDAIRATDARFEDARDYLVYRFVRDSPVDAAILIAADTLPTSDRGYYLQQVFEEWAEVAPQVMVDFARSELDPTETAAVLTEVLNDNDFPAATERLMRTVIEEASSP